MVGRRRWEEVELFEVLRRRALRGWMLIGFICLFKSLSLSVSCRCSRLLVDHDVVAGIVPILLP